MELPRIVLRIASISGSKCHSSEKGARGLKVLVARAEAATFEVTGGKATTGVGELELEIGYESLSPLIQDRARDFDLTRLLGGATAGTSSCIVSLRSPTLPAYAQDSVSKLDSRVGMSNLRLSGEFLMSSP
jgi:hypothetical protein